MSGGVKEFPYQSWQKEGVILLLCIKLFSIIIKATHRTFHLTQRKYNSSCPRAGGELLGDQPVLGHLPHEVRPGLRRRHEPDLPHPGAGPRLQHRQVRQRLARQTRAHHRRVEISAQSAHTAAYLRPSHVNTRASNEPSRRLCEVLQSQRRHLLPL